jgi:hypothetical protein
VCFERVGGNREGHTRVFSHYPHVSFLYNDLFTYKMDICQLFTSAIACMLSESSLSEPTIKNYRGDREAVARGRRWWRHVQLVEYVDGGGIETAIQRYSGNS